MLPQPAPGYAIFGFRGSYFYFIGEFNERLYEQLDKTGNIGIRIGHD